MAPTRPPALPGTLTGGRGVTVEVPAAARAVNPRSPIMNGWKPAEGVVPVCGAWANTSVTGASVGATGGAVVVGGAVGGVGVVRGGVAGGVGRGGAGGVGGAGGIGCGA